MNLLKDKVVIITGGTKGIGLATAYKMAEEGAIVYACARNEIPFDNKNIHFLQLDVTDSKKCQDLADRVIKEQGKIDGLIADAGIINDALINKMTDEMFNSVMNVNVTGVFNIIKAVQPYMDEKKNGSIVTISSIVGEYGNIGQINYSASKAALIGMTKSCAKEFARKGQNIRVNCVAPGYILTDMVKNVPQDLLDQFSSQTMLKRLGEPNEIADVLTFLVSDMSSYITGTVIDVNGGMRL